MSSGWKTIDKKSEKQERDRDRKARRKAEAQEEASRQATTLGGESILFGSNSGSAGYGSSLVGATTRVVAPVIPSKAVNLDDTDARRRRRQEQEQLRQQEAAITARRKQAADRARANRDPKLWPLASTVLCGALNELKAETVRSLEGIPGAECSYVRALYAIAALEQRLQNTVACDDDAKDSVSPYDLPLLTLEDDDAAAKAAQHFATKFLTFGADGDAETMFNLWTSVLGSKGSTQDAHGKGLGNRLGLQLLIRHNIVQALMATSQLANAFIAVDGNLKFHTNASWENFVMVARHVISSARRALEASDAPPPFTGVQLRNACVSILRALSNDGCSRWANQTVVAGELLTFIAGALELALELPIPPRTGNNKSQFFPMLGQDAELLVTLMDARAITPITFKMLILELGVDHHVDSVKGLFSVLLAIGEKRVAVKADMIVFTDVLSLMVEERGADLFPMWSESFAKTPVTSSGVLTSAVARGGAIDRSFLEKVTARSQKLSDPLTALVVQNSLGLAERQGLVSSVVEVAKQQRRNNVAAPDVTTLRDEVDAASLHKKNGSKKSGGIVASVLKIAAVCTLTGYLLYVNNAGRK